MMAAMEKKTCMAFLVKLLTALVLVLISVLENHEVGARFVVEKSSITVLSPMNMHSKRDGAIGNFGVPDYGGYLAGSLVYPEKGSNGCEAFEGDKPFKSKSCRPNVLLLDRGGCYFALKVWNGQQAGAAAVLVADSVDEPLITMDSPEESNDSDGYIEKIGIPSALIEKSFGESLKEGLKKKEDIIIRIDWREAVPHPDERVEYEFWTNTNDECGARCDEQMDFVRNFRGHAQILEKGGYTLFTPHYITWYCPLAFIHSSQCKSQCINNGRYCAPDPEKDFGEGYQGKDVVLENLRQLCVHRVAKESNRPWVWWDYATDFHIRCSMKEKRYSKDCAENVIEALGLPIEKIRRCIGDPEADMENEVLRTEQELQVGRGSRGDVTILPTVVINNVQYRGKLERSAVLKAICAGFKETTDPPVCLSGDIETNECAHEHNGGCWRDTLSNVTACKDTFRGRVCKCPVVNGVQYQGDGYTSCTPFGSARCSINNGGCWSEVRDGLAFSACSESDLHGCRCPHGFHGDGQKCEDVDECKERSHCQCNGCSCRNTWGGYECKCKGDLLYIKEQDACIERNRSRFGWFPTFLVLAALAAACIAGYIFYKYRLRSYMDTEIMAIMSQYMPLDNQHNNQVQTDQAEPLRQGSV
ncbi:vacuolar-sorting receptor 6-like [Juglans microcarpa x Juglans regia]|uniref:vacuolar-sorting receptor 6-like n=1 Tax=Juglans microcarpa x Juglans regia TaxID=2249226 RepID=UPI001B7E9370|nr:vacuolar-sorting receptor 6-like [Juglans microcarpa x Juglans regia]XP_041023147.1 vacuolar-sorting receptor 6-like [Juglans microcarpa x Juglans regia]